MQTFSSHDIPSTLPFPTDLNGSASAGVVGLDPSPDEKLFCLTNGLPCSGAVDVAPDPGTDVLAVEVSFWTLGAEVPDVEVTGFFFLREEDADDVDALLLRRTCPLVEVLSSNSGVGVVEREEVREWDVDRTELLRRSLSVGPAPEPCRWRLWLRLWLWLWLW